MVTSVSSPFFFPLFIYELCWGGGRVSLPVSLLLVTEPVYNNSWPTSYRNTPAIAFKLPLKIVPLTSLLP